MVSRVLPCVLTFALAGSALMGSVQAADAPPALPTPAVSETSPTPSTTERQPSADPVEVAADALVVRPVGLAATAVGAAIYVVALPFAAIAGDVSGPGRSLVGAPARFTFKRKLGDFGGRTY